MKYIKIKDAGNIFITSLKNLYLIFIFLIIISIFFLIDYYINLEALELSRNNFNFVQIFSFSLIHSNSNHFYENFTGSLVLIFAICVFQLLIFLYTGKKIITKFSFLDYFIVSIIASIILLIGTDKPVLGFSLLINYFVASFILNLIKNFNIKKLKYEWVTLVFIFLFSYLTFYDLFNAPNSFLPHITGLILGVLHFPIRKLEKKMFLIMRQLRLL